ncbi:fructose-1,6-bisphosphatase [Anaerocolumna xylanovorans]|uniref:Fructose-1,6-bisphosphatase class 3 n=1 Tax=Anaerocolumna xylanovorans DSM 12503 TaxID=1121345 RepID=A0A1M7XY77_9FIRM|nr:fructose-1,6-bisphosphatase [Anaerocolumna xylanovorans]SHO43845.1 fructose-1,6-bisphosphatase-3 [Anaerocolumna xylanovorans DSM 12503]
MNSETEIRYLKLLSKLYPTIDEACTEMINLQAILNLPKGTEHFLSDIHGEDEAFNHVLKNASGVIRKKITDLYGKTLEEKNIKSLATLIYYPEEKLELVCKQEKNLQDWYRITLYRLIEICKYTSSKYTRSKVRKMLPREFAYIIEELLHEQPEQIDKEEYYNAIINTIISVEKANEFIVAMSELIQQLVIDHLHIIGDIFDRGPGADKVMETLYHYHSVDLQWGNHDILWMGAASGHEACIATVVRICARYSALSTLEDGYGINLLPLATFAMEFYNGDLCDDFKPKISSGKMLPESEIRLISQMHKAIAIIQFKLEGSVIRNNPTFHMNDRLFLEMIDYKENTIKIDGSIYQLKSGYFPTVNPENPYLLTPEEIEVIEKLKYSFKKSERLQKHMDFLITKGSMYLSYNSNLLYHGCIPLNKDGSFAKFIFEEGGQEYKGKALLDRFDAIVREGYLALERTKEKEVSMDIMWYLWTGPLSPLFGKDKMTTFQKYFIEDKSTYNELKNAYYTLINDEHMCQMIFDEFGLDSQKSHIINGHVPVITKKGESPIKANGKLLVIDGGFSKAYQEKTGIAGYTLVNNSYGLFIVSHSPFEDTKKAILEEKDIVSSILILENEVIRKHVGDTDIGRELKSSINDLKNLIEAYRKGRIKEKFSK